MTNLSNSLILEHMKIQMHICIFLPLEFQRNSANSLAEMRKKYPLILFLKFMIQSLKSQTYM